jgi:2-polyprenyl-3-methyl-5-hydroxy-6-metoxy-1,4-benzoquinol methylase
MIPKCRWKPARSRWPRHAKGATCRSSSTRNARSAAQASGRSYVGDPFETEAYCPDPSIYESERYRAILGQGMDAASFFEEHDALQMEHLSMLWPHAVRGKRVADVGCAAGSFLDHISGLAATTLAIEPCTDYHESLRSRGHRVYASTEAAAARERESVDVAFSFSVVEHVANPRTFLAEIAQLLGPNGELLVSTPNRRDVLLSLLPEEFGAFFYRTVHRWYFDVESFRRCAELAGLTVVKAASMHRFGIANALIWLRDRRPSGHSTIPFLDSPAINRAWQSQLEEKGVADYLYFWLRRSHQQAL